MLRIDTSNIRGGTRYLEIDSHQRVQELPEDIFVLSPIASTAVAVSVTGGVPASAWNRSGYFELTFEDTATREVVYYGSANGATFSELVRGVEGDKLDWSAGTRISAVAQCDPEAQAVILMGAEAQMYSFWFANRALYTQYVAAAALGALDLKDIATLVGTQEARAQARYARMRKAPPVGVISHD